MELQAIQSKIHEIRGQKIMLDFDLALLYEIENKYLKRAVKRNINRFPEDFMFELSIRRMGIFKVPNWHLKQWTWTVS